MLLDMTHDEITSAVRDCLARCYSGGSALGIIAEFAGDLRAAGWEESDIRQVETAVRRVLAGMMSVDEAANGDQ